MPSADQVRTLSTEEAARATELYDHARKAITDVLATPDVEDDMGALFHLRNQARIASEKLNRLLEWSDDGRGFSTLPSGKVVNAREAYFLCELLEKSTGQLLVASHPETRSKIIPEKMGLAWAATFEAAQEPLKAFIAD